MISERLDVLFNTLMHESEISDRRTIHHHECLVTGDRHHVLGLLIVTYLIWIGWVWHLI